MKYDDMKYFDGIVQNNTSCAVVIVLGARKEFSKVA